MLKTVSRSRLFQAFGDWVIQRAMRTPYTHLTHDDGRPYMNRYWFIRIMPWGWRARRRRMETLHVLMDEAEIAASAWMAAWSELRNLRDNSYPWFGIRVHHIVSSDDRTLHDHPWTFATLILRGGYTEATPLTADGVVLSTRAFRAGAFRIVRASHWHYLTLAPGQEAWTLFFTARKSQGWGFLVDGIKVPWRTYLDQRAACINAPQGTPA